MSLSWKSPAISGKVTEGSPRSLFGFSMRTAVTAIFAYQRGECDRTSRPQSANTRYSGSQRYGKGIGKFFT